MAQQYQKTEINVGTLKKNNQHRNDNYTTINSYKNMKGEIMIDPITWSTEIATGIIWQDYQHKELLGIINTLREKVSAGSDIDNSGSNHELINFLVFYTGDHLGIEEKYMDLLKYPGAEQHKEEHLEFLKKVDDLKKLTSFSVGIKSEALLNDLARWFFKHINNKDQQLGVFLKDNGIK